MSFLEKGKRYGVGRFYRIPLAFVLTGENTPDGQGLVAHIQEDPFACTLPTLIDVASSSVGRACCWPRQELQVLR